MSKMKYVTLAGLIMLIFLFTFSIFNYANSDRIEQKPLGEYWNKVTGLSFFSEDNSTGENLAVTISAFVLGVSIVYMLLRVVNGMIFAEKIS